MTDTGNEQVADIANVALPCLGNARCSGSSEHRPAKGWVGLALVGSGRRRHRGEKRKPVEPLVPLPHSFPSGILPGIFSGGFV